MPDEKLVGRGTEDVHPVEVRVFLQDPLVAATDHRVGLTTLSLPGEPYLGAGPTTGRVRVIDLDADQGVVHPPVKPLARGGGFAVGRADPVENRRFHQANVWAIVQRTLHLIE
ncbi:MAG: hypothetical protein ACF8XB_08090, partial [Planctomycetota bacterium JB042]